MRKRHLQGARQHSGELRGYFHGLSNQVSPDQLGEPLARGVRGVDGHVSLTMLLEEFVFFDGDPLGNAFSFQLD